MVIFLSYIRMKKDKISNHSTTPIVVAVSYWEHEPNTWSWVIIALLTVPDWVSYHPLPNICVVLDLTNRIRVMGVMGVRSSLLEWTPFVAMVVVECLDVGLTTLGKAAMSRGMSHYVFVVYSNALATLILLPSSFFINRYHLLSLLTVSLSPKLSAFSSASCLQNNKTTPLFLPSMQILPPWPCWVCVVYVNCIMTYFSYFFVRKKEKRKQGYH